MSLNLTILKNNYKIIRYVDKEIELMYINKVQWDLLNAKKERRRKRNGITNSQT